VLQKVVVIGGNGFVGSAVCKAILAKGIKVTSVSLSGKPFATPKGYSPAWTSNVDWQKGDALDPGSYAHHLSDATAVVHTLGTLIEGAEYKEALKEGNLLGLISSLANPLASSNPLGTADTKKSYVALNRDSALRACEAYTSIEPSISLTKPRTFVHISAEDVFRPWIPAGYIEMKREAELGINQLVSGHPELRAVHIRPSLIYHPHYRPLMSPLAAALDLSSVLHSKIPRGMPTPSGFLRALASMSRSPSSPLPPSLDAMANALTIPPIHVDHVGETIAAAVGVDRDDIKGVYGVREMRELMGWLSSSPVYSH